MFKMKNFFLILMREKERLLGDLRMIRLSNQLNTKGPFFVEGMYA